MGRANAPDAANPAIASVFHAGRLWRWVADPGRWPYKHHEEYAQRRGITEDGNNPEGRHLALPLSLPALYFSYEATMAPVLVSHTSWQAPSGIQCLCYVTRDNGH